MNCDVQKHKDISKVEKDIVLRPSMAPRCTSSASPRPSASVAPLETLQDHRPPRQALEVSDLLSDIFGYT